MVSSGEIARGLSGLRGPVPTRFVWQRRTLDYQLRDSLSDAGAVLASRAPRLELDNDRAVLRSIRGIELLESALADLPGGPFDSTSDNVAVVEQRFILGAWRDFPLGLFRLELGDTRYGSDGEPVIECDAADIGTLLTESGPSAPYTVTSGTNFGTAASAVLDTLGLSHDLVTVGAVLPVVQTWAPYPETSWWQVVHDLADGIDYRTPWPNEQGRFLWSPRDVDPSVATEAVTYSDADEPKLIDGDTPYRRRQHAGTLRNLVVVLIDDPLHPDFPTRVVRENADAASPVSTTNRPERQFEVRSDSRPTSTRAILDAATAGPVGERLLREEAALYRTATLSTLPDPRRGAHEYYRLVVADRDGSLIEDGTLWRVARWSRDLAPGGRQTHEVEQVEPVTITDPEA
ncbi:MAG: hypothetical protein FJ035_01185 [Chloroflexi bacterium]|nr:hypothetical protein [Chloroflexota bacterium]